MSERTMTTGQPLSWPALLATLRRTPERLASLVTDADARATTAPGPDGDWSVAQHIAHLCAVESPYHARLVRIALEDNPRVAAIGSSAGEYDLATPATILVASFAELRASTLAFLETLSPIAYSRPALHAELGPITLRSQVEALARHDEHHLAHLVGVLGAEGRETT